jgi:hypothetical protein
MHNSISAIFLACLLAFCTIGCGPSYGYRYGDPYQPYWGGYWNRDPVFMTHHPWEDHEFGHPSDFNHFGSMGRFGGFQGGFHGGGFHGGGFHGGGHGR